jgi:hypothetical protein
MQCLPGPCQRCGAVLHSAYAFSAHQRDLIGSPCLSAAQMQAAGMVYRAGQWFVSDHEAGRSPSPRRCIPLPGDTIDFWHSRLVKNPLWIEEQWDGSDEGLWQKFTLSWHVVHATVVQVSYCGAMVTIEADHPSFGPGWRSYGPFEGFDLVRPGETPERRGQIYEAWLCLRRSGIEVREEDLVFTDPGVEPSSTPHHR